MASNAYPSDSAAKFVVRLPDGMRERFAEAAKANGRTMNAEMVAALQASLDRTKDEEIERLQKEIKRLEGETAPYRLTISRERADLLSSQLFAIRLAKAIPPEALQSDPELYSEAYELLKRERQVMLEVLEASILNFAELPGLLRTSEDRAVPRSSGWKPQALPT